MISVLENSSSIRTFLLDWDFQLNSTDNGSANFNTIDGYIEICFPRAKYLQTLHWIYMATIICVGLVGNFLSFLVLLFSDLKLRSSSYYLAALAVSFQVGPMGLVRRTGSLLSGVGLWLQSHPPLQNPQLQRDPQSLQRGGFLPVLHLFIISVRLPQRLAHRWIHHRTIYCCEISFATSVHLYSVSS